MAKKNGRTKAAGSKTIHKMNKQEGRIAKSTQVEINQAKKKARQMGDREFVGKKLRENANKKRRNDRAHERRSSNALGIKNPQIEVKMKGLGRIWNGT